MRTLKSIAPPTACEITEESPGGWNGVPTAMTIVQAREDLACVNGGTALRLFGRTIDLPSNPITRVYEDDSELALHFRDGGYAVVYDRDVRRGLVHMWHANRWDGSAPEGPQPFGRGEGRLKDDPGCGRFGGRKHR